MPILTPGVHRMFDFGTVVTFAVAPMLLGLTGLAAMLAYALAVVHLGMTLATRFPGAASGYLPLRLHGAVEVVVGVTLVVLPLVLRWAGAARSFFVAAGIVILAVWALSAYDGDVASGLP